VFEKGEKIFLNVDEYLDWEKIQKFSPDKDHSENREEEKKKLTLEDFEL